jgi:TPR repeat protein
MKSTLLTVFLLVALACTHGPVPDSAHFEAADGMAADQVRHADTYERGVRAWQKGRLNRAITEFEYIAYQGSAAASLRLCAIYGEGLGVQVAPVKAMFWCRRAAAGGYPPARRLMAQLFQQYWEPLPDS